MAKEILHTDRAPQAIGPYSQGVRAGGFVFFSGQIPLDPVTGQITGARYRRADGTGDGKY